MERSQFQVSLIANGYLVASAPSDASMRAAATNNQQPQPVVHYCADYDEVCDYIKQFFRIS